MFFFFPSNNVFSELHRKNQQVGENISIELFLRRFSDAASCLRAQTLPSTQLSQLKAAARCSGEKKKHSKDIYVCRTMNFVSTFTFSDFPSLYFKNIFKMSSMLLSILPHASALLMFIFHENVKE